MTDPDALVQDYLDRLGRAAARLDPERRHDLVSGITEHIDDARAAGAAEGEAGVRTLLDRLGEPSEVVAATVRDDPRPGGPDRSAQHPPRRRGTGLELAAVVLMTAGSFLPVVGWLVGMVLMWCSDRLRASEKVLGTLVVPLGPGGLLLLGGLMPFGAAETCVSAPAPVPSPGPALDAGPAAAAAVTCTASGPPAWLATTVVVLLLLASVAVPVWLYRTALRRADAEQESALQLQP